VSASVTLVDRFRGAGADWQGPKVHYGLLLSANTLVNSAVLRAKLKALEPDAIGGEMEGAGAYAAGAKRKVDWVVAKAIADWGAGKTDDWQVRAARAAARFVLHVVSIGGLDRPPGS
jgi:nucleoside phosphorylase